MEATQEMIDAYEWRLRLENLGILEQVEDFIVEICEDLEIEV